MPLRCLLISCLLSLTSLSAAKKPNILIILTDDMGFSDLGCFGGEIDTPHLDALAAGGVRFTEFYNTARCWPTRATLMSGRYEERLRPEHTTITEVLKSKGYQTGMAGKWHLSENPIDRGFDTFYGTLSGAGSFWNPPSLSRGKSRVKPDGPDYYYTDKLGEEAVAQIEAFANRPDAPFFQYLAFTAPHWPLHAPEATIQKYLARYQGGWEKTRADRYARMLKLGIIDKERWPMPKPEPHVARWKDTEHKEWHVRNMAIYAAMVDHMDQAVGKVVTSLRQTGQLDNTFIIFLNDNGASQEQLSGTAYGSANNIIDLAKEQGKTVTVGDDFDVPNGPPFTFGSVGPNWANTQNTPLRRYKTNVHEGGACTPAIVHWPAGINKTGKILRHRGHVVDLMATCLELSGATYPKQRKGNPVPAHESRSILPALTEKSYSTDHPFYFNHNGTHAVIKGDWKVIRERKGPWHLYNLSKEKTELTNLAAQHPERVKELASLWEARFAEEEKERARKKAEKRIRAKKKNS